MDERQIQVRGNICIKGCIGVILYFMAAAFVNDFGILNIQEVFGFSEFMIVSAVLMITYVSLATIWRDAYFGVDTLHQMKLMSYVFLAVAIMEDVFFVSDCIQGELPKIITLVSLFMVNSLAFSLWYKKREYKKKG